MLNDETPCCGLDILHDGVLDLDVDPETGARFLTFRGLRRLGDEIERLQRQLEAERRALRINEPLVAHLEGLAQDDPVESFLAEVRVELLRARAKFPGDRLMTVALAEEFGELCKAVLDEPAVRVRKEAVQTATMAARLVLDGDGSVAEWRKLKGLDPLVPPPASEQGDS